MYAQLCTVPPCLSGAEGRIICLTVSGETADRGGRIEDAVAPLLSVEGETTLAKQLIIMDEMLFIFASCLQVLLFLHLPTIYDHAIRFATSMTYE
jgi:hypothetical protein